MSEGGEARNHEAEIEGDYELVRVDRLMVERLIDDDSEPVVVMRLRRLDDGTCVMVLRESAVRRALNDLVQAIERGECEVPAEPFYAAKEELEGRPDEYDPLPEKPDPFERTMPLPARSPQGEDHEAEIEAVAQAIANLHGLEGQATEAVLAAYGPDAEAAIAALDAVRSSGPATQPMSAEDAAALDALADHPKPGRIGSAAQNHEASCEFCGLPFPNHTDACEVWKGTPVDPALDPQGEDHEAERPTFEDVSDRLAAHERATRRSLRDEDHKPTHPYAEVALGPEEFVTRDDLLAARSPRGDPTVPWQQWNDEVNARIALQIELHDARAEIERFRRSPQDEDHEALRLLWQAREALRFTCEYAGEDTLPAIEGWSWYDATVAIDAYLSRCPSPERDTVDPTEVARLQGELVASIYERDIAERERYTERLVEAASEVLTMADQIDLHDPMWQRLREALSEFSDASKEP